MELNDLPDFLDRELDYPTDVAAVRRAVGDVEVVTANAAVSETIGGLLASVEAEEYDTANDLFEALLSRLPDEYVGRKFYDDRGGNPSGVDPVRTDEEGDQP